MKMLNKLIFVISIFLSGHLSAATITWDQPSINVTPGQIFTLDIIGTDFLSNVDGGGVNIAFDETVLNVLSVTIDEVVWDFGGAGISTGTINNTAGTVNGIMVNTFANVSGDFVVASIQMQAAAGISLSSLVLTEYALNPWASGGSGINPAFVDGNVAVVVPVPAAVWLFGSGLLGLFGVAKRKAHA